MNIVKATTPVSYRIKAWVLPLLFLVLKMKRCLLWEKPSKLTCHSNTYKHINFCGFLGGENYKSALEENLKERLTISRPIHESLPKIL